MGGLLVGNMLYENGKGLKEPREEGAGIIKWLLTTL
jgi:hypothetical protein